MKTNFDEHFDMEMENAEVRNEYAMLELGRKIAVQIKTVRESMGIQQKELAELLKTGQSRISQMENPLYGKYTLQSLIKIADVLDCELDVTMRRKSLPKAFLKHYSIVLDNISLNVLNCFKSNLKFSSEDPIMPKMAEGNVNTAANNVVKFPGKAERKVS